MKFFRKVKEGVLSFATGCKKLAIAGVATAGLVASSIVSFPGKALAALPVEAGTALTSISLFVTDIIAGVWPIAAAVAVGALGFKLFTKFTNRAT